jgi:hypothetical protein
MGKRRRPAPSRATSAWPARASRAPGSPPAVSPVAVWAALNSVAVRAREDPSVPIGSANDLSRTRFAAADEPPHGEAGTGRVSRSTPPLDPPAGTITGTHPTGTAMARKGRIPKLTPELTAAFAEAVGGGLSRAKAAAVIGVTPKTVCVWMRVGRTGRAGPHVHFVNSVRAAEAKFVAENVKAVRRAATPARRRVTKTTTRPDGSVVTEVTERTECDWQAAKWLLECRDPDTFGADRRELAALKKELAEVRQLLWALGGSSTRDGQSGDHPAPTAG